MIGDQSSLTAMYLANPQLASALRRQQFGEKIAAGALGTEPIQSHTQGLAKLGQALVGVLLMGKADRDFEAQGEKQAKEMENWQGLVRGLMNPSSPGPVREPSLTPAPQASAAPVAQTPPDLAPFVQEASERTKIPPDVLAAVLRQESGGNPNAVGDGGQSIGPMQVQNRTALQPGFGVAPIDPAKLTDPRTNINFGADYLAARARAAGVSDWNDPTQRAKALQAYNGGGDPNYVANVERYMPQAGGAPVMAQSTAGAGMPSDLGAEMDRARQLQMLAMQAANSPNPQIRGQAQILMGQATQAENRVLQQQARMDARANRIPHTITMQDPDGKGVGIYEMTPQGAGQRIGNAPKQAGESGPFMGTGMEQQANNVLLSIGPKIKDGTASEADRDLYAAAYEHLMRNNVAWVPDPNDPTGQRQTMARIPGAVSSRFPSLDGSGAAVAPAASGYGATPGAPQPIPGTTKPAPAMTEAQGRIATFADRINSAMPIIEETTPAGLSYVQSTLRRVPLVGNSVVSNDTQKLEQAQRNFINAVLRRESGAVISPEEFNNAEKQYFPRPGDGADVLEQKRKNRQDVLEGFKREAGPQYKVPENTQKILRYNPLTKRVE